MHAACKLCEQLVSKSSTKIFSIWQWKNIILMNRASWSITNYSTSADPQSIACISSSEVRQKFLDFFTQKHNHIYVPPSPVHLTTDTSSLYVSAGMTQFKPIFLGTVDPKSPMASYRRVVNCQKCIGVGGKHNDLNEVGRDGYHHTFFEMLGSWSFNDYFKKEACEMALTLLTESYQLPREKLYFTYFSGDDKFGLKPDLECRDIWLQLGIPKNRILPFGMKDNFWDMGDVGPCGPCTEIHYTHGSPADAVHLVNSSSPEVVEIWNLVFMQYEKKPDGTLQKLPVNHVDTGMGLERLSAILQGSQSNYDTDLFQTIFDVIYENSQARRYKGLFGAEDHENIDQSYRIIADHARMFTVSIADGVIPDYYGAGYPLRHIIRRAALLSKLVLKCPFGTLGNLVYPVVNSLGTAYTDLEFKVNKIVDIVNSEEERFHSQLDKGFLLLNNMFNELNGTKSFPGEKMFQLYFVHGFPEDILTELITAKGFIPDMDQFNKLKEGEREKSRQAHAAMLAAQNQYVLLDQQSLNRLKSNGVIPTDDSYKYSYKLKGQLYEFPTLVSKIVALGKDGHLVDCLNEGDQGVVILDKTNFYSEAGGQPSDVGSITANGTVFEVSDVKSSQAYIQHTGTVTAGALKISQSVLLSINSEHRLACMQSHSATHVISEALSQVLGDVNPRSFYSGPDSLRMDLTIKRNLTENEIQKVEGLVKDVIEKNYPVTIEMIDPQNFLNYSKRIKTTPGMHYPNPMRVVTIGENNIFASSEACCGTHVRNSGDLKAVVIVAQRSSGQVRRIKAISGAAAEKVIKFENDQRRVFETLKSQFEGKSRGENLSDDELVTIEKELRNIRTKMKEHLISVIGRVQLDADIEKLKRKINQILKKKKNQVI